MDLSTPIKKAKFLADWYFSRFIRARDSDIYGIIQCVTCGKRALWKKMDCGHFQSRGHMATRYNERNADGQCKQCNGPHGSGRQYEHGLAVDKKWGNGTADSLLTAARTSQKMGVFDLLLIAKTYRELAKSQFLIKNLEWSEAPGYKAIS